jgi:hypothetical protein
LRAQGFTGLRSYDDADNDDDDDDDDDDVDDDDGDDDDDNDLLIFTGTRIQCS